MTEAEVTIADEPVLLLPERALYRRGTKSLYVADAHVGKAASFRAHGIPVPGGTTAHALGRLDGILQRHETRRMVFLGDFLHAREGRVEGTLQLVREWRTKHSRIEMLLVRGNHDRGAGDPPTELGVTCEDEPVLDDPFVLRHYPAADARGYVLAGHVHPAVRLSGRAAQRERLPCFLIGKDCATLPAFGDFTGTADVVPRAGDRIYVVAEGEVVAAS